MRRIHFLFLSALLGVFLIPADAVEPAAPVRRNAGICFRFDDNQPLQNWKAIGELFEKHGFRMSLAIVSQDLSREAAETLRELSRKGHTLLDHLPNHAVYHLRAHTQQEFEAFSKLPIVDHVDPKSRTLYFKYELDANHPGRKPFRGEIRNGELIGYPESLSRHLGFTRKVLIPSTGKVYGILIRDGKKMMHSFWWETIDIPDTNGPTDMVLLPFNSAIQPPDALLRFLAERTRENFRSAGLPLPRTWAQPGGWECFVEPERIARIYGREFGYLCGSCVPHATAQTCCYNEPDPAIQRFCMRPDSTSPDNRGTFAEMKKRIADAVARHVPTVFLSHLQIRRFPGGREAFFRGYDELLAWVKQHNIPVKTHEQWAVELYDHPSLPLEEVMPPLTVDRNGDGIPDGYDLKNGAKSDLRTGRVSLPAGGRLQITNLGGIDRGPGRFSVEVKGPAGALVTIEFRYMIRNGKPSAERKTFRLKGNSWESCSGTLSVPSGAVTLHYTLSAPETPIEIRSPKLKSVSSR